CVAAAAQPAAPPKPTPQQQMTEKEENELRQTLGEAGNSSVDFQRALEDHLAKYPNTARRAEFERALIKTAIDLKDNARIIKYGEAVLTREPDDLQILEKVTVALLQTGGTDNLHQALKYAEHFDAIVTKAVTDPKTLSAHDLARRVEDRDRALARAYLLEARAHGLLGENDQAIALAEKSYKTFASVEAARECSRWLEKGGKTQQAIDYLADAFSIAGLSAASPEVENDRKNLGDLYRKLNGTDKGLGDAMLKAYDRTSSELAARREQIRQIDPNSNIKDPMQYTISAVDSGKLDLASL